MDARKGNIFEILNGNKQFLIPVYQRYYSWDIEQCRRLWNDIVDMQKRNKAGHFVGSIVKISEQAIPTGVQKVMMFLGDLWLCNVFCSRQRFMNGSENFRSSILRWIGPWMMHRLFLKV